MALKPVTTPDIEGATVELSIDGRTVTAKDGVSLYDVISSTGKIVPAMCYHYTFDPFGSCGMCLVTVEGKKAPVRSEEHTSELQSLRHLVCRLLLEKKKAQTRTCVI